jgi:hypothetical protein
MKKKVIIILIPLIFIFFSFKIHQKENILPRLPVLLAYKNITPDSIQMFIKLYLQSKKVKVVDQDELTKLVGDEIMSAGEEFIRNANSNINAEKFIRDKLDPVGNIISLQIFNSRGKDSVYVIDSINWKINHVPAKDTIPAVRRMFINPDKNEEKLYTTLKSFFDEVLTSGYLK